MKNNNKVKSSEVKNVKVKSNRRNNKVLVGTLILAGMTSIGIYAMASADENKEVKHGRNYSPERHERMEKAFESNNYNAWKAEMDKNSRKGRVMEVINEENFAKFAEAWKLGQAGDKVGADAIRAELGLRTSDGKRGGHGFGKGEGRGNGNGEGRGQGQHRVQNQ